MRKYFISDAAISPLKNKYKLKRINLLQEFKQILHRKGIFYWKVDQVKKSAAWTDKILFKCFFILENIALFHLV